MQENNNWYWKQQSLQHNIIFTTRTIINPCVDVVIITDVQDIPKTVCNIIQLKKSMQRYPICMKDAYCDNILD